MFWFGQEPQKILDEPSSFFSGIFTPSFTVIHLVYSSPFTDKGQSKLSCLPFLLQKALKGGKKLGYCVVTRMFCDGFRWMCANALAIKLYWLLNQLSQYYSFEKKTKKQNATYRLSDHRNRKVKTHCWGSTSSSVKTDVDFIWNRNRNEREVDSLKLYSCFFCPHNLSVNLSYTKLRWMFHMWLDVTSPVKLIILFSHCF